jgi:acyl-CoA synthetase (AMP-forming)/AMP-acid ligase II
VIRTGRELVLATEVERVIKTHTDVTERAVFALPDEKFGEAICPTVVLEGHQRASLLGIVIRRRTDDG